jgi:hypothetical protein
MTTESLNIVIGVCAGAVALIAFGGEIADKTRFKLLGKIWFKIVLTIVSFFFGIWASVVKDNNSAFELSQRDSVNNTKITAAIEASSKGNIKTFTDALAKYHLGYAESQDSIINFLKKNPSNSEIPDFDVMDAPDAIQFNKDSATNYYRCKIAFKNFGNCPIIVSCRFSLLVDDGNQLLVIPGSIAICANMSLSVGTPIVKAFGLTIPPNIKSVHILFKASYSTYDKKIVRSLDRIYSYDFENKLWGIMTISNQERVLRFITSNKIKY